MIFASTLGSYFVLPVAFVHVREDGTASIGVSLLQRRRQFISHGDAQVASGVVCQLNVNFGDGAERKAADDALNLKAGRARYGEIIHDAYGNEHQHVGRSSNPSGWCGKGKQPQRRAQCDPSNKTNRWNH